MKMFHPLYLIIGFLFFTSGASASVTIQLQLAKLTDSQAADLPTGTLWALISEDTSAGDLPGGLLENSSLYSNNTASTIINDFGGKTIDVGQSIGGGEILATGGIKSSSDVNNTITYTIPVGVLTGDKLGVYWFPGRTTVSNVLPISDFEIGGFQRTAANTAASADAGLVVDSGATYITSYFDTTIFPSGGIPSTEFQAINVVPEPSALLFLGTGILFLLRRRR